MEIENEEIEARRKLKSGVNVSKMK